MAEGEVVNDVHVQQYSLDILINCLCNPIENNHGFGIHYRFTKEFDKNIVPKELHTRFPSNESSSTPIVDEIPASTSMVTRRQRFNQMKPFPTSDIFDNKGVRLYIAPEQIQQILWLCAQQNNAIMVILVLITIKAIHIF